MKIQTLLPLLFLGLVIAEDTFLVATDAPEELQMLGAAKYPEFYGNWVNITYAQTLNCGACVQSNHTFCWRGVEGQIYNDHAVSTDQICCKDDTQCANYLKTAAWTCTKAYNSSVYAKYACPFNAKTCGPNNTIELNKTGDKFVVNLTITPGDTCFFQYKTNCGVPAFEFNSTEGLDIEFIDFEEWEVNQNTTKPSPTSDADAKNKPPKDKFPFRNNTFINGTEEKGPVVGKYDPKYGNERKYKSGKKMWGNETECSPRSTLIAITSLINQTVENIPAPVVKLLTATTDPVPVVQMTLIAEGLVARYIYVSFAIVASFASLFYF